MAITKDREFRDLIITTWETGARPQETLVVEARHVDLKNARWVATIPYLNPAHGRFLWPPQEQPTTEVQPDNVLHPDTSVRKFGSRKDLAPHQRRIYDNLLQSEQAEYLRSLDEEWRLSQSQPSTPPPPPPSSPEQTGPFLSVVAIFFSNLTRLLLFVGPTLVTLLTVFFFAFATTTRISARFEHEFHLDQPAVKLDHNTWQAIVKNLRLSGDPLENESIFVGLNACDGTPVLVPRDVFKEHAHFLGDSGSGKTSLGLSPLLAQLISFCDSTVVVLDLKGDDMALFRNVQIEAQAADAKLKTEPREDLPPEYPFSLDHDRSLLLDFRLQPAYAALLSHSHRRSASGPAHQRPGHG